MPVKKSVAQKTPPKQKSVKKITSASKEVAGKKKAPKESGRKNNDDLIALFTELMFYESKDGNGWAAKSYKKVIGVIEKHTGKKKINIINSGSDIQHYDGVGKGCVGVIDEFLCSQDGKLTRLEELRERYGDIVGDAVSAGCKSAVGRGKSNAVRKSSDTVDRKSAAKKKEIKAAREHYSGMATTALKQILKTNGQVISGDKSNLVERCVEGKVFGALPLCPLCHAGKLRWDNKKEAAICPGYMDDDTFRACVFEGSVERAAWVE